MVVPVFTFRVSGKLSEGILNIQEFKPIEITKNFYQLGIPFFPVYLTQAYHLEMLVRVSNGDDPDDIAKEKAQWVLSISDHMP